MNENKKAASGDASSNNSRSATVGRVSSPGVPGESPPRRLRRLHRVWPDRDGNISYLLTICADGRSRVFDNAITFERFVGFLFESPKHYRWFGRRFVIMPDHIHLIAHMGHDAIHLGQWMKALKAVVGSLERRTEHPVETSGLQNTTPAAVGRVSSPGFPASATGDAVSGDTAYRTTRPQSVGRVSSPGVPSMIPHEFTRIKRAWRWQEGFHDHKFRTPESESRKWEYVCLNPVRAGLVKRPEEWPFGGEIFYDEAGGPRLIRGTPPLLDTGILATEEDGKTTPREDTRPTESYATGL